MAEGYELAWDVVKTLGSAGWDLVVSNQKLGNLDAQQVNAVPKVDDWQAVYGSAPADPIDLTYEQGWYYTSEDTTRAHVRLYYSAWGKYQERGAYIPNAWVDVVDIDPTWWTFAPDNVLNIEVKVHGPENSGTPEDPVAALGFSVNFNERSAVGEEAHKHYMVWIYGDGRAPHIS
ncbi:MAG: hypothetical protein ACRD0F_08795 [Acidimicrobiales bacterium]